MKGNIKRAITKQGLFDNIFAKDKKAITPIIATVLLLVVVVVAFAGFQNWFNSYSSGLFTKIDQQSSSNSLSVKGLIGNVLYLQSESDVNLTLLKVENSAGKTMCSFSGSTNVSSQGLVGWWKFNSDSSTIKDYSGNGNDGKLYGDTRLLMNFDNVTGTNVPDATAYENNGTIVGGVNCSVKGINGNSCDFNGVNGYINVSKHNNLFSSGDVTISLWIKLNHFVGDTQERIINQQNNPTGAPSWGLEIFGNNYSGSNPGENNLVFHVNNKTNVKNLMSKTNLTPNVWYNIVGVYQNNSYYKIYINGKLDVQNISINNPQINSSVPIILGADFAPSPNFFFNGSIDELGIYSTALTSSQIQDLYNSQKAKFIEFQKSNLGQAVDFDGKDDYVNVGNKSMLNPSNLTIVSIYKINGLPLGQEIMVGKHLSNGYILGLENYGSVFAYYTNSAIYSHNPSQLNSNSVLVGMFNGTSSAIYQDGILINSSNVGSKTLTTASVIIGAIHPTDLASGGQNYKGLIDEVRIYNRTLTPSEVKKLYWYSIRPLQTGINLIGLSSCNLVRGNLYDIVGFTNNQKVDQTLVAQ